VTVQQVAVDAFGNALGQGLVDQQTSTSRGIQEHQGIAAVDYGFGNSGYVQGFRSEGGVGIRVGALRATDTPPANEFSLSSDAEQRLQLGLTVTDYGDEYAGAGDRVADPTSAVRKQINSDPLTRSLWKLYLNGFVSTTATMLLGGSDAKNLMGVPPEDLAAWKQANPNPRPGERPTVQVNFDADTWSWKTSLGTTEPLGQQFLNVLLLGTVPVGNGLGTFFGGAATANDDSLSYRTRQQGAYDAGGNTLALPAAALMVGAPSLKFERTSAPVVNPGEFSIVNWAGYPAGVPRPQGPFKIIDGAEYDAARAAANRTNNAIRQDQGLVGQPVDIHEVQPVKFNGDPVDPANKLVLPRPLHRQQVTPWWSQLQRDLTGK
jgi:hypothetical protein